MIRTNRFQTAFVIPFGFAMALSACDGGSDGGSGGSGGAGGSDGTLRILVTNDDGVGAPGIDVLVEALITDANNEVVVSAPAENRSGTGDSTIDEEPSCGSGEVTPSSTASGYDDDVWAVDGCPADSVIYALENLYPDAPPHVVLSGINEGQNVGNVQGLLSQLSGTVGAAKTAACADIPAMASSQGDGETIDYPSGLAAALEWLDANRAALLAGEVSVESITSINIPSCDGQGEIRGTLEVPLATENPNGYLLTGPQDCTSTIDEVPNDVEAFFNGYTTITPVPRATTCPGK
jgi:5'-nucleotidase